jgi:hypothetical protein
VSFTHHGYTHLELAQTESGKWTWVCESCDWDGRHGKHSVVIESNSPLELLIEAYHEHVAQSHKRTRQDFEGWSNGL